MFTCPGERGYLSTETTPWTADTTGGSLGRPFPDSTTAAAGVTPNNPFNSYLQQSLPGLAQPSPSQQGLAGLTRPSQSQQSLSGLSQPSQSQQSSSSQPGAQYPVPQPQKTTSGHSSHSQPDYAHDKMQSTFDVKTANGTKTYSLTVDGLDEWLSRAKAGHFKGKGGAKKSSKKQADDLNGAKMSSEGFGWDKGMTPRMKAPTSRPRISTMPGIRSQMGAGSLGYGLDPSIFAPDSGSSAAMSFGNGFQMLGGGFNEGTTSGMQMSAGIGGDGTTLQGGLQMLDKSSQRTKSSYPMPAELQKSGSMYPSFNGDNGKSANFGAQTSTNGKAAGSALEGGLQSFGQRENGMKSSVQTPADSVASRMTLADALKKINEGYRENMTTPPMQTPANQSMVGLTHGGNVQMTTGGFDKDTMFSGMQTPSDSRADSVMYASDANQLSDIDPAAFFDCDRMHRSFGATHDLSPAKTPDIVVTYADMDPKKRPQPASSPTPSAKRMRLLLPAQTEQIDWSSYGLGGSNGPSHAATSSPAKMPTQRGHTTDASSSSMHPTPRLPSLSSPSADFLAPPAPIMAPDAIHLPPAQAHAVVENLEDAANLPSFGCGVEQGDGGDWSELLWDGEIDWRQVGEEGRVFGGGE